MDPDKIKRRWAEIEWRWKFNSCDEASDFWEDQWGECPVCGEKVDLADPLDSATDKMIIHKDPDLLTQ